MKFKEEIELYEIENGVSIDTIAVQVPTRTIDADSFKIYTQANKLAPPKQLEVNRGEKPKTVYSRFVIPAAFFKSEAIDKVSGFPLMGILTDKDRYKSYQKIKYAVDKLVNDLKSIPMPEEKKFAIEAQKDHNKKMTGYSVKRLF